MWKLALAGDAIMLTIGAYAIAFAPDASETSSKDRRWALAWRSWRGDSGREIGAMQPAWMRRRSFRIGWHDAGLLIAKIVSRGAEHRRCTIVSRGAEHRRCSRSRGGSGRDFRVSGQVLLRKHGRRGPATRCSFPFLLSSEQVLAAFCDELAQPRRPSRGVARLIAWRALGAFKVRVTMAAVTAESLKVGHQQRVRCPELRRFVDGEAAALTL